MTICDLLLETPPEDQPSIPLFQVRSDEFERFLETHDAALGPLARGWIKAQDYQPNPGSICLIPCEDGGLKAVLIGYGDEPMRDKGAFLFGKLPAALPAGIYHLAHYLDDPFTCALAWCLGSYSFDRYKTTSRDAPQLVVPGGIDLHAVQVIAAGVELTRDLINTPANDMGPAELANAATKLAEQYDGEMSQLVGEALLQANFPLIHAVGRAADEAAGRAPRLIDLSWGALDAPKVTLVGKGVVFDTGGLDIKPPASMLLMKKDMGGAATVLGLAAMIMAAKVRVRLRVLIPAVENAISGNAFRPGDVLPSRSGKTVEIGNTDAEGRLVLADALTFACEEEPDLLIDMATLTGAARVALGPDLAPFYCDDPLFAADLEAEALAHDDLVWRLPLHPRYRALLESDIADINHISAGAFAGSITAALFLKEFTKGAKIWAHFDLYGWVPTARPARPKGGDAQSARALFALLCARYGTQS